MVTMGCLGRLQGTRSLRAGLAADIAELTAVTGAREGLPYTNGWVALGGLDIGVGGGLTTPTVAITAV